MTSATIDRSGPLALSSTHQSCTCNAGTWALHFHKATVTQEQHADTCAARLAALGLAPPASSHSGSNTLRLVPAAATVHITAATISRRILYDSMSKQLDGSPLQVGEPLTYVV